MLLSACDGGSRGSRPPLCPARDDGVGVGRDDDVVCVRPVQMTGQSVMFAVSTHT